MTIQDQPAVVLNDGRSMPQFGLGVFQTPPEATAEIVRKAVGEGYRLIDTAAAYRNEDGVGEALDGRADIFVTTKLWNADHGFDKTLRAFKESARKLRRKTLDLYLIHWPQPRFNRYVESWKALIRLKSEGRDPLRRRLEFQFRSSRTNHRRDRGCARRQSGRASPSVSAEGFARVSRPARDQDEVLEPARPRVVAERNDNRRHCREARQDPGASRDPLASRIRPDRHSQDGAARTPEGKHRRAELPSRRGRYAPHRSARTRRMGGSAPTPPRRPFDVEDRRPTRRRWREGR